MEIKMDIKTLSVNKAWLGRKIKSAHYRKYEEVVLQYLDDYIIDDVDFSKKLEIEYHFGFSNSGSDIDNPIKPLMDILQKKYNFNDKLVYRMIVIKDVVKKGKEYFKIKISNI